MHAVLSGALSAAKRWGWITVSPLEAAQGHQDSPDAVIKLDQDTITILGQHKAPAEQRCADLSITLDDNAFVFSYAPDHRRHCDPDAITTDTRRWPPISASTHTCTRYATTAPLNSSLAASTGAPWQARLGHAGGGATTLKVYAAWLAGPPLPGRPLPTTPAARPTTTKLRSVTATTTTPSRSLPQGWVGVLDQTRCSEHLRPESATLCRRSRCG